MFIAYGSGAASLDLDLGGSMPLPFSAPIFLCIYIVDEWLWGNISINLWGILCFWLGSPFLLYCGTRPCSWGSLFLVAISDPCGSFHASLGGDPTQSCFRSVARPEGFWSSFGGWPIRRFACLGVFQGRARSFPSASPSTLSFLVFPVPGFPAALYAPLQI